MMLSGKTKLTVPDYQREYSWDGDRVEGLWEDLIDNCTNLNQHYLLGPVITVKRQGMDPFSDEIVDGQQRLVTLTLLFCALRDALDKHKPTDSGDRRDYEDLAKEISELIETDDGQPRIKLSGSDDKVLARICAGGNRQQNTESDRRIVKSYHVLLNNTSELCERHFSKESPRTAIRNVRKLLGAIKDNTYFIYVEVADESYTYQVFQSLNSKGQKLNQADLIKSLLLNIQGEDKRSDVKNRWDEMMSSREIRKKPDDFLYYSMLSRTCSKLQAEKDEVLKKRLYSAVKKRHESPGDVDRYLDDLQEDSRIIEMMSNPDTLRSKANYDPDFAHLFYGMQQINAKYFRRPTMAACRRWGLSNKTKDLMDCLLKFFFMYRTISKSDTNQIRRIAEDVTCQILDGKSLDEMFYTILKSERSGSIEDNVDQGRFMEEFKKNVNDLKRPVAAYILYSLEKELNRSQGKHVDSYKYHIEHIFPNNPNNDWTDKDELQNHKNRLGNLTLLDVRFNSTWQNKSFGDKLNRGIRCYSKSGLELNKRYLVKYKRWGVKEIEDREKKLIEHAKEIWDLSEYSKRAKKPQGS